MRDQEPADSQMSSATATSRESGKTEERRSFPRESLKRHVVLVFFGEDNWGKLTNMSESGMAIEFAKPPSLRERITFTVQAMGCMPMPRNGKALGDSFEAPGEIVWTRDFERGAGVHFVDLEETSRQQIREWLAFEAPPILAELLGSLESGSNTESAEGKKKALSELDRPVPFAEVGKRPDFSFLESSVARESYAVLGSREEPDKEPHAPELQVTSHPSVARWTFLVVSGCLAAFAVTAGVRIYMTRAAYKADAEVRASNPAPATVEPTTEVNVSSPLPTPGSSSEASVSSFASPATSSGASEPPFQVDVLDANGRDWILWFVHGEAKNKDTQLSYRPSEPTYSFASTGRSTKRQESAPLEKPQATHTFTMVGPNVSHAQNISGAGQPSGEAPTIPTELTPTSANPFGGPLGSQMKPAAPDVHPYIGGMVQPPRLMRTAPLVYPPLAKSMRVSGNVVVDARIDTKGNVTTVRALSGPVLLQQAAMDTVRLWKYEPALLDGQAAAMHLSVTVRFRLN